MGLRSASLQVAPGELVALLGPNGSGKTTLLRILATDLEAGQGTLRLFGSAPRSSPSRHRRRLGYAPDHAAHLEPLSGLENAVLFGRLAGLSHFRARTGALELFRRWGLGEDAETPVESWSFGMRRKLVLTQALLHGPELLLLDEPTVGLDPPSLALLRTVLRERVREGVGVVVATNDVREAERIATRVLFLHRGEVVLEGTPRRLLAQLGTAARIEVELEGFPEAPPELPGALTVESGGNRIVATARDGARALPRILEGLISAGLRVRSVRVREPHLGDVFRRLVGVPLTDKDGPDA